MYSYLAYQSTDTTELKTMYNRLKSHIIKPTNLDAGVVGV